MPIVYINKINISYEERGYGEPLVLIMGLGADKSAWERHVKEYEKHFRCILIDNRGSGGSDKPDAPYTTAQMAEDVVCLMEYLSIENALLAGISMGSAITQELAIKYPQKVLRLLLVSSWSRCDAYTKAVFEHFIKMRAASSPNDFVQLLQLWIYSADYYNKHIKDMLEEQKNANSSYMPFHAFRNQCKACINHNTYDRLKYIKIPTLLTVGDSDIFTPIRLSQEMQKRIPKSTLRVFKRLGHCHHWEDLKVFNEFTVSFLKNGLT